MGLGIWRAWVWMGILMVCKTRWLVGCVGYSEKGRRDWVDGQGGREPISTVALLLEVPLTYLPLPAHILFRSSNKLVVL